MNRCERCGAEVAVVKHFGGKAVSCARFCDRCAAANTLDAAKAVFAPLPCQHKFHGLDDADAQCLNCGAFASELAMVANGREWMREQMRNAATRPTHLEQFASMLYAASALGKAAPSFAELEAHARASRDLWAWSTNTDGVRRDWMALAVEVWASIVQSARVG